VVVVVLVVVLVLVLVVVFRARGIDCTTDDLVDASVVVAYTMFGFFVDVDVRLSRGMLCTTDTCSCNGDIVVALKPVPFDDEYETLFISPSASTKPNVPLILPRTSRLST